MCGGSCPGVPLIAQMVYTLLLSTKAHLPGQAGQWVVWGVG